MELFLVQKEGLQNPILGNQRCCHWAENTHRKYHNFTLKSKSTIGFSMILNWSESLSLHPYWLAASRYRGEILVIGSCGAHSNFYNHRWQQWYGDPVSGDNGCMCRISIKHIAGLYGISYTKFKGPDDVNFRTFGFNKNFCRNCAAHHL